MKRVFGNGRYANVTATLALIVALGGTAYAANTIRSSDIVNGQVKRVDLANNAVTSSKVKNNTLRGSDVKNNTLRGSDINESTLGIVPAATNAVSASNAGNASALGGKSLAEIATASAFGQSATVTASLGGAFVTVASANITTTAASSRVIATGSAEIFGSNASAQCRIVLRGVGSLAYEGDPDDIGVDQQQTIAVTFARVLPAGVHAVLFQCRALVGTVGKDDAAVAAWSAGA